MRFAIASIVPSQNFCCLLLYMEKEKENEKEKEDRSKHKGIYRGNKRRGNQFHRCHRSREGIICLKEVAGLWIDISHNISETFIVHAGSRLFPFDVSPYLANALHLVHTRDTAVRCSSPFSSRFHRLQISTKITKGGEGRLGNQQRILDLEFHDTSLFSSWESSSLSHYFSSFENQSSLNYSQLNGRFVFILKIFIKSWLEKFRVEVFLFFLR